MDVLDKNIKIKKGTTIINKNKIGFRKNMVDYLYDLCLTIITKQKKKKKGKKGWIVTHTHVCVYIFINASKITIFWMRAVQKGGSNGCLNLIRYQVQSADRWTMEPI